MDRSWFKTRLSRMFQGSLNSCRARNLSDVVETAVLIPQNHHQKPPLPVLPYNINAFPSLCKPRHYCNEKDLPNVIVNNSIIPRKKFDYSFLAEEGFTCPPASPLSPPFYKEVTNAYKKKKKKNHQKKIAPHVRKRSQEASLFRSSSQDSAYYYNWFSSDEEEEKEGKSQEEEERSDSVFFSSRSNTLSSDSSVIVTSKRHRLRRRRRRAASHSSYSNRYGSSTSNNNNNNVNLMPLMGDQSSLKDSFAVVKSSSDPHNDFRASMMEMITEKQIFGAKELEQLLQCFLYLNSEHHHRIIVEVFTEIWEALFFSKLISYI